MLYSGNTIPAQCPNPPFNLKIHPLIVLWMQSLATPPTMILDAV
jgi:hypothetical protein